MRQRGRRWSGMAGAAGIVVVALLGGCKKQNAFVPPPPASVGVAVPLRQAVTPRLELTGNTSPVNQADLVARVEGFLQAINFQDGAPVKRGDTLFVIEPLPYQMKYQQAQAALAGAQASLTRSETEFNRQAALGGTNVSSQAQVDQARAARDGDRANVANQQANVTLAGVNLGYTNVLAPFDGVATAHQVSVGNLVGATGPTKLASVVQLNPIYATFNVSEQDVLRIKTDLARRGLSVADLGKVPVEIGLMNEEGLPHKGVLDYIAPVVDPASGTLQVRGVFPNPERTLLPGFFVRAAIPLAPQAQQALLVPDDALGADQAGRYLLVAKLDDTIEQRHVGVGALVGRLRVIESGIGPEDRVVISGLQRATPGARVAPRVETITP